MVDIKKRLYLILVVILLVVMGGSFGYYALLGGKASFMNCLFMTVISLTSVGYGEIVPVTGNAPAVIFTIILITFGMGIILYGISTLTALVIEGELSGLLRKKKMEKEIAKLKGHYIVCGGGETGRPVLGELVKNREAVVLVETDEDKISRCRQDFPGDLLFVKGDASEDQNLVAAGIQKAAGIIITLANDKDTLFVTMSARMLNPKIRIISRMVDPKLELKLRKAGADSIVSPNFIGALRMASEMIRPTAVNFLDSMLRSQRGNLRIHQITVSPNSSLAGRKIQESGLKDRYRLLVLGARDGEGEIEFNPSPSRILVEGTTLVVMGEVDDIAKVKQTV